MTVVDSRPDLPEPPPDNIREQDDEVLLSDTGVTLLAVDDMGAGRGPFWLDQWLARGIGDLVAWRRHLHAHPELSRQEYATTDSLAGALRSAGLSPRILPGRSGLICDVGSGERTVALRADIDALPLVEDTDLDYRSVVPGACHACGHDVHTTALLGAALALA